MADAAAFFANKKKKKKAFKFNANKIDAASVETKVHVDAPALSTDADVEGGSASLPVTSAASGDAGADSQWDDAALAAATTRKATIAAPAGVVTKDWADLQGTDFKSTGDEKEDIAKKLQIEETKAQFAAAKQGMMEEGQRLKEEKEKKEQEAKDKASNRFGAAAAGMSGGAGGKWVSSRMRAGGMSSMSDRFGGVSLSSQKVNTEDENLFPDLASADKILEQQKNEQPAFKAPKKTPVGGGASWGGGGGGGRPKLNLKPKTQSNKEEGAAAEEPKADSKPADTPKEEPAPPAAAKEEVAPPAAAEPAPVASTAAAAAAPAPIKPKKKKKKDLSTFGKK